MNKRCNILINFFKFLWLYVSFFEIIQLIIITINSFSFCSSWILSSLESIISLFWPFESLYVVSAFFPIKTSCAWIFLIKVSVWFAFLIGFSTESEKLKEVSESLSSFLFCNWILVKGSFFFSSSSSSGLDSSESCLFWSFYIF